MSATCGGEEETAGAWLSTGGGFAAASGVVGAVGDGEGEVRMSSQVLGMESSIGDGAGAGGQVDK